MGMASTIDLTADQRRTVLRLLNRHLPNTTVWAYGSRVKWTSHPASDLDLVAFAKPEQGPRLAELREAFDDSFLPFRVDLFVWDDVPKDFRKRIEADHVVLARENQSVSREWPTVTLGDCIEMNDATYAPRENWRFVNYLDTGNITDNRIAEIQQLDAGRDKIPSRARRKIQPGDIVYSTVRPNHRHFGMMKAVPENFLASTAFAVIRGKKDCAHTDFLYWFLAQDSVVDRLHTIAEHSASAYPSIRPADIERLTLGLPPISEQRAIAHVLGVLDEKIELSLRMAKTLEEAVGILFKSWFLDRPTSERVGWRWWRLEELATNNRDLVSPYRQPALSYEHYSIPAYDAGCQPVVESGSCIRSSKALIPKGAVLVSKLNPATPRVWVPDCRGAMMKIASTEFLVFVPKTGFGRGLLCAILSSKGFQQALQSFATGTSKSHQRASRSDVVRFECVAGQPAVFAAFEAIVAPLVEEQAQTYTNVRLLRSLRNTLLPKLISGEIRIQDAEKLAEAAT